MKKPPQGAAFSYHLVHGSALAGFEPTLGFIDHVNAALAAHDPAIPVARLQGAKRVPYFHVSSPFSGALQAPSKILQQMVGTTRFELVTPSMSTKCSTTELSAHLRVIFTIAVTSRTRAAVCAL